MCFDAVPLCFDVEADSRQRLLNPRFREITRLLYAEPGDVIPCDDPQMFLFMPSAPKKGAENCRNCGAPHDASPICSYCRTAR